MYAPSSGAVGKFGLYSTLLVEQLGVVCFVWLLIVSNDDNIKLLLFVQVIPDQFIDAILQACYSDSYDKLEHTVKVGTVCGCDGVQRYVVPSSAYL